MTTIDSPTLRGWLGRSERRVDLVTEAPLAALSATLDHEEPAPLPGSEVPPLWHWLYFTPVTRQSDIGPDGHARRGGFLPPVPLPRRMWAGGRLEFLQPLRVGDEVTRVSRIIAVDGKQGRSGPLVFVTVRHEFTNALGMALTEEHDIVYREPPRHGAEESAPQKPPGLAAYRRTIVPDPVLLFRYSALTFNGHRIHYDRSYVTEVEGYPGLIVHGPLIATLLLELLRRQQPALRVRRFSFKAVRPVFDIHPFEVCGCEESPVKHRLWALDHQGHLAMQAQVDLEAR